MVKLSFSIPEEALKALGISVSKDSSQKVRDLLLTLARKKEFINTNANIIASMLAELVVKYKELLEKSIDQRSLSEYIELFSVAGSLINVIRNLPLEKHELYLIRMVEAQQEAIKLRFDMIGKASDKLIRFVAKLLLDDNFFAYIGMIIAIAIYILGSLRKEYEKFKEVENLINELTKDNLVKNRVYDLTRYIR